LLGVELFQPSSGSGELVNVRRFDIGPVIADILPAKIIRQHENNVWLRLCYSRRRRKKRQSQQRSHMTAIKSAAERLYSTLRELSYWRFSKTICPANYYERSRYHQHRSFGAGSDSTDIWNV
jgi:hypothetical protein